MTHATRLVSSTLLAAIIFAAPVFVAPVLAQGVAPTPAKTKPQAPAAKPAPAARILVSQSPNPTFDEGTIQRISAAMLSYTVLGGAGRMADAPGQCQARAGVEGTRRRASAPASRHDRGSARRQGRGRRLRRGRGRGGEVFPGPPRPRGDRQRRRQDARRPQRAGRQAAAPARGVARPARAHGFQVRATLRGGEPSRRLRRGGRGRQGRAPLRGAGRASRTGRRRRSRPSSRPSISIRPGRCRSAS